MRRKKYTQKGSENAARTGGRKNILKDPVMHLFREKMSPGSVHRFIRRHPGIQSGLFFGRLLNERKKKRKTSVTRAIRKGSLTVEASLAVPIFFLCMVTLICLMDVYGRTASQTVKLQEEAEKAGYAAGMAGLSSERIIDIRRPVLFSTDYLPFHAEIKAACRGRVHAWTGRGEEGENGGAREETKQLVYVTDNRSVYHTNSGCTHLSLSIERVPYSGLNRRRNEYGEKYHACEKCVGSGGAGSTVYISRDGNRYHKASDCGGLTRNVRMVPADEVKGLSECSRCKAEDAHKGEQ